jgi:hypothetical protein
MNSTLIPGRRPQMPLQTVFRSCGHEHIVQQQMDSPLLGITCPERIFVRCRDKDLVASGANTSRISSRTD